MGKRTHLQRRNRVKIRDRRPIEKARVKEWQKSGKMSKEKGGKVLSKKSGNSKHLKIEGKCMEKIREKRIKIYRVVIRNDLMRIRIFSLRIRIHVPYPGL
jgi:hypothetical protein